MSWQLVSLCLILVNDCVSDAAEKADDGMARVMHSKPDKHLVGQIVGC